MYELVVVWETGEKEITAYATEDEAKAAGNQMEMVFGKQLWWCTRRKLN